MKKQLIVLSALLIVSASQCSYYDRMKAAASSAYDSARSKWNDTKYKGRAFINKILPLTGIAGVEIDSYTGEAKIIYTLKGEKYEHATGITKDMPYFNAMLEKEKKDLEQQLSNKVATMR